MAATAAAAIRDEKLALLERLRGQRAAIEALASLISAIEEKFKVIVAIYRSSLVSYYEMRPHRVEYRVWAHSNTSGQYPMDVLAEWMERLIDLRPPNQPALLEIIRDPSNWGYEGDKVIDPDEVAPPGARMDTVYGHAVYDTWQYLFEQRDDDFVEISRGTAPDEIRVRLARFGIEITEEELRRGRRVRHR